MAAYAKRLLTTAAAYQLADIVSKFIAVALLPVYTRHLTKADYGIAELVTTLVIFVSILVRLGIGEAFVRYWYESAPGPERDALARRAVGAVLLATTALCVVLGLLAGPLSEALLDRRDVSTFLAGVLGLWAFTNLELAYALLRVEERAREYAIASLVNVAITIPATVILVVGLDEGAKGLLYGTYGASAIVLVALWWRLRARLGVRGPGGAPLRTLFGFGLPTVPADASLFALNLVDRYYLFHARSASAAGLYSLAVKLAGVVVFTTRAFQYAWPPLAYSVRDDAEAARLYAVVATWYVAFTGVVVAGLALLGRWVVRLLAAPSFFGAHRALPWVALGWALYGLVLILVAVAGRARVTTRNFPAAALGLVANGVLLVALVPQFGVAGAGLALVGAYLVMLTALHLLTRRLFPVAFEWGRLIHAVVIIGGLTVAGELTLPTDGAAGFLSRLAVLVAIPFALWVTGFLRRGERERLVALIVAFRARVRRSDPAEAAGGLRAD
jgi:O-antigen/teichoic acid export membrane protein